MHAPCPLPANAASYTGGATLARDTRNKVFCVLVHTDGRVGAWGWTEAGYVPELVYIRREMQHAHTDRRTGPEPCTWDR
ncbi:hypothetical protein CGRA01v4_07625 [Colletotrichum graminicola]|nr:hypothetical protein CGRA01v4_07625 [Colletotrichum graminicola]